MSEERAASSDRHPTTTTTIIHTNNQHHHDAYPQIILFGDSITEQAESPDRGFGFAPALRSAYIRRADVVNRGFSGYTAPLALKVLPHFLPHQADAAAVKLVLVFFGANDACLEGERQHVALGRYVESLRGIVAEMRARTGPEGEEAKVLLVTPGPVDEWQLDGDGSRLKSQRTAENTRRYAEACRGLGRGVGVPVVDLWTLFMEQAGWREGAALVGGKGVGRSGVLGKLLVDGESFLWLSGEWGEGCWFEQKGRERAAENCCGWDWAFMCDLLTGVTGLHFTPDAYRLMFAEVMKVIREELPELVPEKLPFVFPPWDQALKDYR